MGKKIPLRRVKLGEVVEKYLETKPKSTQQVYRSNLRRFKLFLGKPIEEFIVETEKWRDRNKTLPVIERRRYAEEVVRKFIDWLKNPVVNGEAYDGYENNSIRNTLTVLQNLLKYYNLPLSFAFIDLPSTRIAKENEKHKWKIEEIKEFVDKSEYLRDKAIMLCMFQSGLGVGDIVDLNYGDVRKELEKEILPIRLHLYSKKTEIEFVTHFGADAVKYLKLYLNGRGDLEDEDPLFNKLGSEDRITEGSIQQRFKEYAEKMSFLDEKDLEGFNPVRPHSLRSAFKSRLTNRVDRDLIEFWMGHEIGATARAYLDLPKEEMRELYANCEARLSIETTSKEVLAGREEKVKIDETYKSKVEDTFTQIIAKNVELESQIQTLNESIEASREAILWLMNDWIEESTQLKRQIYELELELDAYYEKDEEEERRIHLEESRQRAESPEQLAEMERKYEEKRKRMAELVKSLSQVCLTSFAC